MNDEHKNRIDSHDDDFSELLRKAGRGPRLSDEARRRISTCTEAAWLQALERRAQESRHESLNRPALRAGAQRRAVTGSGRGRVRYARWFAPALAASLLAVAAVVLLNQPDMVSTPTQSDFGSVVVAQGDTSVLRGDELLPGGIRDLLAIRIGDRLETASDGRVSLQLPNGESLRLNTETTVEIIDNQTIELVAGMIYFDSPPATSEQAFVVRTGFGIVEHIGTQYAAGIVDDGLVVRVREGSAQIRIADTDAAVPAPAAMAGQQLAVNAAGDAEISPFAVDHAEWSWVETLSRSRFDGPVSALTLLEWVARETGRVVQLDSDAARNEAADVMLNQVSGLSPSDMLTVIRTTTELEVAESGAALTVSFP